MIPRSQPSLDIRLPVPKQGVPRLESRVTSKHQTFASFADSGSAALRTLVRTVKPDHVFMSAYTCPSAVNAVMSTGVPVSFLPLLPDSYVCEPDVPSKPRKAMVIVTHIYGGQAQVPEPRDGLYIVEDAAQAFGLITPAPQTDAVVYSFGGGKPINLNGGGLIVAKRRFKDDPLVLSAQSKGRYEAMLQAYAPEHFKRWHDPEEDGWSWYKHTLLDMALDHLPRWRSIRCSYASMYAKRHPNGKLYLNYYPVAGGRVFLPALVKAGFDATTGYHLYAGSKLEHARINNHIALPLDHRLSPAHVEGILRALGN